MGRPPIGERAMTAAEKMRRYRARKFGNRPPVTKLTAAAAERLAARIRELEAELARERAKPPITKPAAIDPASLPKSYRERFEAMCRRQAREFEARVEQRADEEARKLLDEVFLRHLRERLEDNEHQNQMLDQIFDQRRPIISKAMYRKILACLHPDSRAGASEKMFNEAFAAFSEKNKDGINRIEIAVCGKEADRPKRHPRPTWAEIMARREKVRAEHSARAKRAAATRAARAPPTT